MYFTFDNYGDGARYTELIYNTTGPVEVFLIGSLLYFWSQEEMYSFMQPFILDQLKKPPYNYNPESCTFPNPDAASGSNMSTTATTLAPTKSRSPLPTPSILDCNAIRDDFNFVTAQTTQYF